MKMEIVIQLYSSNYIVFLRYKLYLYVKTNNQESGKSRGLIYGKYVSKMSA